MVTLQKLKHKRDRRVDLEGTPPAIFLNDGLEGRPTDIAVDDNGGGWVIDFTQEDKTQRHYPYSIITINNTSTIGLNIYINQNRKWQKVCRGDQVLPISDFPSIRSVRISKRSAGTINAGEVEVNVERPPLNDDEYRRRTEKTPFLIKFLKNKLGI